MRAPFFRAFSPHARGPFPVAGVRTESSRATRTPGPTGPESSLPVNAPNNRGERFPRVRTDRGALSVDVPSWPGRLRTLEPVVQPASCGRIVSRRRAGQGVRRWADAATKVGEKALVDRRPGPLRDPRRQRRCFPGRPYTQSPASGTAGPSPFPPSPHSRVHRVQGPSHHSRSLSGRGGVAPFPDATSQVHAGANSATDVLASRITSSALRGTHR